MKKTILEYYANLFTLLSDGKESFVISVDDIYREATNLNESLGIRTTPVSLFQTKKTFLKIFSKYITEKVEDTTYKGRGVREIYSIETQPSDVVGLEIKLLKEFPRLNRQISKITTDGSRTLVEKKAKKDKVVKPVKSEKPKSIIPGRRLPRKDWLFKFYELLKVANVAPGNRLNKKQIKSIMLLSEIPSMSNLIDSWKSTLSRGGILANFSIYKTIKNETELIISDCQSLIRTIGLKSNEWFGVELNADEVLNITTLIPVEKELVRPMSNAGLSFDIAYAIFALGGICKNREVVSFAEIDRLMKQEFNIKLYRNEINDLISNIASDYFEISNFGIGGIKFKETANWTDFEEKYSPRNFKESSYVRIGMSLEEVKKLLPESFGVEVVTEITASDAIYKLNYDKSVHSLKGLCRLYRTFRGQDKFLDDNLTRILQDKIVFIDSQSFVGNFAYEIECC